MNGIVSNSESRIQLNIDYIARLIPEWTKMLRKSLDQSTDISPTLPSTFQTPHTSINNQVEEVQENPISSTFACHELFFKIVELLKNPIFFSKLLRILYDIVSLLCLHAASIASSHFEDLVWYYIDPLMDVINFYDSNQGIETGEKFVDKVAMFSFNLAHALSSSTRVTVYNDSLIQMLYGKCFLLLVPLEIQITLLLFCFIHSSLLITPRTINVY